MMSGGKISRGVYEYLYSAAALLCPCYCTRAMAGTKLSHQVVGAAAISCILASFSPTVFSPAASVAFASGLVVRYKRFPRLTYTWLDRPPTHGDGRTATRLARELLSKKRILYHRQEHIGGKGGERDQRS